MLCAFSFGCFQIYQNKSAKIIAINFIRTIVPIKYMPKISAVGLFCLYKFENNQTRTCTTFFRMSKLTEPYFRIFKSNHFLCYEMQHCGFYYQVFFYSEFLKEHLNPLFIKAEFRTEGHTSIILEVFKRSKK